MRSRRCSGRCACFEAMVSILHAAPVACLVLALGAAHAQVVEEGARRPPAANVAPPRSADLRQVTLLIVRQTNELRTAHGASSIVVSDALSRAAGYFAEYMARTDQHAHDADGSTPSARAKQHGYNFCMVSENIAMQYSSVGFSTEDLAQRLVAGWENSPEHRKNMLDPHAMETGVALARSPRTGRYYAVQMFGRPQAAMYAFQITNDSGAKVQYRFGAREYDLPARTTRTHEQCRPYPLLMHGLAEGGESSIQPVDGERFTVVRDRRGLRLVKQ